MTPVEIQKNLFAPPRGNLGLASLVSKKYLSLIHVNFTRES
jgi:hypothetical protein